LTARGWRRMRRSMRMRAMSRSRGRSWRSAAEIDAAEDELHGDKRGDELPEQLTTRHGRQAWLREAKRQLEAERAADPKPVPRARAPRLKEAKRRLEEELWSEQRANAAYEAWRATARDTLGRSYTQKLWMRVKRKAAYLPGC
jgi:hypothetical protein